VWGQYWYDSVWRSTGFGPYRPAVEPLPPRLAGLASQCQPYYERLYAHRLAPAASPAAQEP
jgi:hypothetical protein